MKKLTDLQCKRPEKGEGLSADRISELHTQIPEWQIVEREGIPRLERVFKFKNFLEALDFTNQIGGLAEAEDHHPAILTEWGRVSVTFWTHFLKGLHLNDFIAAAKVDLLYPAERE